MLIEVNSRAISVRPIDPRADEEVALVAHRMRETLIEVLGEERGGTMYSMDWLVQRVRWHLDPGSVVGQVFVAETAAGDIVGHTIVRIEPDAHDDPPASDAGGQEIGLFSTTFVDPSVRRLGVATQLLDAGERWMRERGMPLSVTYTDADNVKLQRLYIRHGYTLSEMPEHFVKLTKRL